MTETGPDAVARAIKTLERIVGVDAEMPDVIRPVSWLRSAIDELISRGPLTTCDDPDAFWEMVREINSLYEPIRDLSSTLADLKEVHVGNTAALAAAEKRGG